MTFLIVKFSQFIQKYNLSSESWRIVSYAPEKYIIFLSSLSFSYDSMNVNLGMQHSDDCYLVFFFKKNPRRCWSRTMYYPHILPAFILTRILEISI